MGNCASTLVLIGQRKCAGIRFGWGTPTGRLLHQDFGKPSFGDAQSVCCSTQRWSVVQQSALYTRQQYRYTWTPAAKRLGWAEAKIPVLDVS